MLSVKVVCEECKAMFGVNATNVKEGKIKVVEDYKELVVTYYDCTECGKRYMVQLDDSETLKILSKLKSNMRKIVIGKRNSKVSNKSKYDYDRLKKDLDKMRIALIIAYSDKHFIKNGKEEKIIINI